MKTSKSNPTEIAAAAKVTEHDPRWLAVQQRDAAADGHFFYAVRTTGVFCRPTCGARLPRPENVQFFDTTAQATAAGYRACQRCLPDQPPLAERYAAVVADACRFIEQAETAPALAMLAERASLSTFHFHRVFKAITGLTPKAYASAHRAKALKTALTQGATVTEAIYDAGYPSASRFYAKATARLGMPARQFKAGGTAQTLRVAIGQCSLGAILVAASEVGICAITLGDDPQALLTDVQARFPQAQFVGGDAEFEQWVAQVVGFVEAPHQGLNLPLDVRGTAFQERVWQALQRIPAGQTLSYTEVAERLGEPKAVRAVAGACAANRLAVAIPCHRVVRNDGGLSGYRWGVERKRVLIDREAAQLQQVGQTNLSPGNTP